jgi:high-affinity Fe2+/Pb2+ permease
METAPSSSLITLNEAEEVVKFRETFLTTYRTPLMIFVGAVIIATLILLVLFVISLRGSRTGLEAVFPFLENNQSETLQLPGS